MKYIGDVEALCLYRALSSCTSYLEVLCLYRALASCTSYLEVLCLYRALASCTSYLEVLCRYRALASCTSYLGGLGARCWTRVLLRCERSQEFHVLLLLPILDSD